MNQLLSEMLAKTDPSQVAGLSRFFKTGPGQYGEGDKFLGIKVPVTREVVKACWRQTNFDELEECIRSEYHEVRLAALLTLVQIFTHARKDAALQQRCIDFYLGHLDFVNNWDLVDLSCYELLGQWLLDKGRGRKSKCPILVENVYFCKSKSQKNITDVYFGKVLLTKIIFCVYFSGAVQKCIFVPKVAGKMCLKQANLGGKT